MTKLTMIIEIAHKREPIKKILKNTHTVQQLGSTNQNCWTDVLTKNYQTYQKGFCKL